MNSGLGGVAVQPSAVGVSGQTVHDGPADAAVAIDLEAEIVVGASDGMVVLVDDEVGATWTAGAVAVQGRIRGDGQQARDGGIAGFGVLGESCSEESEVVGGRGLARLNGGGGGHRHI
jgi:hypothetical protein